MTPGGCIKYYTKPVFPLLVDQAELVDKRRSSMAIVQIKLTGQLSQQQTKQVTSESKEEEVEIIKAVTQKSKKTSPTETRVGF